MNMQFRVDVYFNYACLDDSREVLIVGPGGAVEGHKEFSRFANSQSGRYAELLRPAANHLPR